MADRRLKVFHTVARLLSFTKAAEELHMTQPAVTFQVRQLEESFNTRLLNRIHNKVTLTDVGEMVYEMSGRILDLYGDMENRVAEMTGESTGVLTVGASMTVAENMLPNLLGAFKKKYPEVNIRLRVGNTDSVVTMIEQSTVDLGIVEGTVSNKNLLQEECQKDQLVVIMPPDHPLAGKASVKVSELVPYTFICREEGSGTREVIRKYLASHDLPHGFPDCMELGSPETIKGAVQANIGLSIMSQVGIQKELDLGLLAAVPLEEPIYRHFVFVRQRQKFRLHTMEELLDFAREYCEEHCSIA